MVGASEAQTPIQFTSYIWCKGLEYWSSCNAIWDRLQCNLVCIRIIQAWINRKVLTSYDVTWVRFPCAMHFAIILFYESLAQRFQKLIYLHLFTDCFMKISLQSSELIGHSATCDSKTHLNYMRVLACAQRLQKLIYLHLFTDCFMKISFHLSEPKFSQYKLYATVQNAVQYCDFYLTENQLNPLFTWCCVFVITVVGCKVSCCQYVLNQGNIVWVNTAQEIKVQSKQAETEQELDPKLCNWIRA